MRNQIEIAWPRTFPFFSLMDELDGVFDGHLNRLQPEAEVETNDSHYLLTWDMPGVKKEDLKIEVADRVLTVTGERKRTAGPSTRFQKSYRLPDGVDVAGIEAQLENGVLHLALPKAEQMKARRIEIQTENKGLFSKLLGSKRTENESPQA